jgi:hypothetical protein
MFVSSITPPSDQHFILLFTKYVQKNRVNCIELCLQVGDVWGKKL